MVYTYLVCPTRMTTQYENPSNARIMTVEWPRFSEFMETIRVFLLNYVNFLCIVPIPVEKLSNEENNAGLLSRVYLISQKKLVNIWKNMIGSNSNSKLVVNPHDDLTGPSMYAAINKNCCNMLCGHW